MSVVKCLYGKGDKCTRLNSEKQCDVCTEYIPICKFRTERGRDLICAKFDFRLGDVANCKLKLCNVCGTNNVKSFPDLMVFFEEYTMKNLT